MSSLLKPNFTAVPASQQVVISEIGVIIPKGLPQPVGWRLTLTPVRAIKKTKGGIFLPDEVIDAQSWNHQLHQVAAVGPGVFKGQAWKGTGMEDWVVEIGDLYMINPRNPEKFRFHGMHFITVADDNLKSKVDPKYVDGLEFFGMEL